MKPQFACALFVRALLVRRSSSKLRSLTPPLRANSLLRYLAWDRSFCPSALATLLTLSGGWLVSQAIAPAAVQAYPRPANIALFVQPGDTYDDVVRRAEGAARSVSQQRFARDPRLTQVNAIVVGKKDNMAVPLLAVTINRAQAQNLSINRRSVTSYPNAKSLLGLESETGLSAETAMPTGTSGFLPIPDAFGRIQPSTATQTGDVQLPSSGSQMPILPSRIPTPAGIGK